MLWADPGTSSCSKGVLAGPDGEAIARKVPLLCSPVPDRNKPGKGDSRPAR